MENIGSQNIEAVQPQVILVRATFAGGVSVLDDGLAVVVVVVSESTKFVKSAIFQDANCNSLVNPVFCIASSVVVVTRAKTATTNEHTIIFNRECIANFKDVFYSL